MIKSEELWSPVSSFSQTENEWIDRQIPLEREFVGVGFVRQHIFTSKSGFILKDYGHIKFI